MLERRNAPFTQDGNRIGGYAAVYNEPSLPLAFAGMNGGKPFTERVKPGAFDTSLGQNIQLLVQHDPTRLVANTKSGLLSLTSDQRGLAFEVQLPDTTIARDVRALVEAGVMREMSFGFFVRADQWNGSERLLTQVDLREVSIVEAGAYPQTSAESRTLCRLASALRLRLRTV